MPESVVFARRMNQNWHLARRSTVCGFSVVAGHTCKQPRGIVLMFRGGGWAVVSSRLSVCVCWDGGGFVQPSFSRCSVLFHPPAFLSSAYFHWLTPSPIVQIPPCFLPHPRLQWGNSKCRTLYSASGTVEGVPVVHNHSNASPSAALACARASAAASIPPTIDFHVPTPLFTLLWHPYLPPRPGASTNITRSLAPPSYRPPLKAAFSSSSP